MNPLIDSHSLIRHIPPGTYERGLGVFRAQAVLELQIQGSSRHSWALIGQVQGTAREPYTLEVGLEVDEAGRIQRLEGLCSCPVSHNCKHVVALVIKAALHSRRGHGPAPSAPGAPATASAPLSPVTPADSARQRQEQALRLRALVAQRWLEARLTGTTPPGSPQAQTLLPWRRGRRGGPDPTEQIAYLVRPTGHRPEDDQAAAAGPLTLAAALIKPLADGSGWGLPTALPYHQAMGPGMPAYDRADPDEQLLLQLLGALNASATHLRPPGQLDGPAAALLLERASATGRLFWQARPLRPLRWAPARPLAWAWREAPLARDLEVDGAPAPEPAWRLWPRLDGPDAPTGRAAAGRLHRNSPWLGVDLEAGTLFAVTLDPATPRAELDDVLQMPPLPADLLDNNPVAALEALSGLPPWPGLKLAAELRDLPPRFGVVIRAVPTPQRGRLGLFQADLSLHYGPHRVPLAPLLAQTLVHPPSADGAPVLVRRHPQAEFPLLEAMGQVPLLEPAAPDLASWHRPPGLGDPLWLQDLEQDFAAWRALGLPVQADPSLHELLQTAEVPDFALHQADGGPESGSLGTGQGWFELSLGVSVGGQRLNLLPLLPALLRQLPEGADGAGPAGVELPEHLYLPQADGRFLKLPGAPLKPWLWLLLELVRERGPDLKGGAERLRLSQLEALRLGSGLDDGAQTPGLWAHASTLRDTVRRLAPGGTLPSVPTPQGLRAELRPYQLQGLAWLQFLRQLGLGGVLADDMGLGKTVQTLAHLLVEQAAGRLTQPALIVAPVSLLGNWQREAARFAPSLNTRVFHGLDRHSQADFAGVDLVIAPYSLLTRERERWLAQPWSLLVLDEAQHIKNPATQAAQAARDIVAGQRLALTGTPLENHLGELWGLFGTVAPGLLGSETGFRSQFRTPIEKHGDTRRLAQLRARIAPLLLRRHKSVVATELPPKVESVNPVRLAGPQADLYETIRLSTEQEVRKALAEKGLARSQVTVLDALLKLRQVCCDPRLLPDSLGRRAKAHSAKLQLLEELLPEMVSEGRRVLVFSQFTSMLSLIEERLRQLKLPFVTLTGQTRQRDAVIERFTSGEVPVFLISLKAGGTGLNLPQADTVIHYDPWWNPAVEQQANDRAHRIGQTQSVWVLKLVAQGTIEERMLALQERKAALAAQVLDGGAKRREPLFSEQDLQALLAPMED